MPTTVERTATRVMSFYQQSNQATLDPSYFNYLNDQRRQANDRYNIGVQQNQYDLSRANVERANALGKIGNQFAQSRRTLSQGIAGRGLANSGVWQRRVGDHLRSRNEAYADLQSGFSDTVNRLALARQALEAQRASGESELFDQEAEKRAATAAMIRNNLQGFV